MSTEKSRKESIEHAGFLEADLEQSKSNIMQAAMDLQRLQRDLDNKTTEAATLQTELEVANIHSASFVRKVRSIFPF